MILNKCEFIAMNNPIRAFIQRRFEARRLFKMGGAMSGGRALEIGCGRGVGVKIILEYFGAASVDAFDLDPRMIERAARRLKKRADEVRLWVGDATRIEAADSAYDAVFDFGIVHHVPDWRKAVSEVLRVLKPGGRFYAEEVLLNSATKPLWTKACHHPEHDRFNHEQFLSALTQTGFRVIAANRVLSSFAWYVADKPA